MNYPDFVRIKKVVSENKSVKSIFLPFDKDIEPGQFLMITIPGIDEIPMSVSRILENEISITFKRVGDATSELFKKSEGEILGVRGPLGRGFDIQGERILFVAGGTGIAPIAPAVEKAKELGKDITTILGAKTKDDLFFVERLKRCGNLIITTDDGSAGKKGFASDAAEEIMDKEDFDLVITCGPEIMMKKILDICLDKSIDFQASVERYIKCGLGLCGQCCIGEGLRVCKEGPVFSGETLKGCKDFGCYSRDSAGRRVYLRDE